MPRRSIRRNTGWCGICRPHVEQQQRHSHHHRDVLLVSSLRHRLGRPCRQGSCHRPATHRLAEDMRCFRVRDAPIVPVSTTVQSTFHRFTANALDEWTSFDKRRHASHVTSKWNHGSSYKRWRTRACAEDALPTHHGLLQRSDREGRKVECRHRVVLPARKIPCTSEMVGILRGKTSSEGRGGRVEAIPLD
nr:hypothetical protein CFP56_52240 [Quercus suber]